MAKKTYKTSDAKRKALKDYYKNNRTEILKRKKNKRESDKATLDKKDNLSKTEAKAINNKKYRDNQKKNKVKKKKLKQYKTNWARKKNMTAKQNFVDQFNKEFETRYGK